MLVIKVQIFPEKKEFACKAKSSIALSPRKEETPAKTRKTMKLTAIIQLVMLNFLANILNPFELGLL
jgi:hypothetical protein